MKYDVNTANSYIKNNKNTVNKKYRFYYHMMPPVGWMNDPNGLSYYKGKYHLFYQFYPYKAQWGPMHWGHFTSGDLIEYNDEGVALAPDNEEGTPSCFSGGALVENDELQLIYTKHYEKGKIKEETVCRAISKDGMRFEKCPSPIFDNNSLPENISRSDFRDPYPVIVDGNFYIFVGGRDVNTKKGLIVVLKRDDGGVFRYAFSIGDIYELGNMAECPSYTRIDGKDVLLVSGCKVRRRGNSYKNINSSVFITGKIDFENGKMQVDSIREIDKGECFYAPQFVTGRNDVMIGWFEMWNRPYPTYKLCHNWTGAFAIPRKIFIKNNTVCQQPVAELENYYDEKYDYSVGEIPPVSDVIIRYEQPFKIVFKAGNGSFTVGCEKGRVYADTRLSKNGKGSVRNTDGVYHDGKLRILFDVSGAEIFVGDGEESISCRIYLDGNYKPEIKGNVKMQVTTFKFGDKK